MSDSPPRDPKIAEAEAPPAADAQNPSADRAASTAPGAGAPDRARAAMSSNLQYLLKQPSTPWIMFGGDTMAAEESGKAGLETLDEGWGEANRAAPVEVKPPVDVPPPPAYLLAVVDEVLSQSRPPPADPGPADAPRVSPAPLITPAYLMPPVDRPVHVARAGVDLPPPVHVATLPQDFSPRASAPPAAPIAPVAAFQAPLDETPELAPARKKSPILFIALGGGALAMIAIVVVVLVVLRSPASPAASAMTTAPTTSTSVASAASSSPPSDKVTLPVASAAASVVVDDSPPSVASAPAVVAAVATSAPSAAPVSAVDPKTGAKRASYLTIPRAASKHHIFLDGKLMLGNGARSFPVKCGEHTLAIDDRKAVHAINVTCGGEYVVTN